MASSRTRIPSPARSMPMTPRRRETPRKTRSVCSPARSNASGRLSCIIREHTEQALGSFVLSPLTRKSVLNDNTDIEEPKRKSWWRDLGETSRDVMEVLKDNNVETDNIFDNIEILSQEEKQQTLDLPDSSDSESIQSIIIPQRKLFHEKENKPQKKFNQFGTRETLDKIHKTDATEGDKPDCTVTKEQYQTKPRTRPVFPAALLDISASTTASEKTMTAVVETKGRVRNFFSNQNENNHQQATKRKNMFAKFIASDSEEELPEIQPKYFALQKKPDSRRPSLTRGFDASIASSMDIELDDWQLLPSSTMVDHQLNTTLTAGQRPTRTRLSNLLEAETGTNSSDTSQKVLSVEKSPQQNTTILTRNSSKISKDAKGEIDKSPKSQSRSNTSQSSISTRSKNSSVANKSQNASINKSLNKNKSKNSSQASIKLAEIENVLIKSVSKSPVAENQNVVTDNKDPENEFEELADNEEVELNFTMVYEEDNPNEVNKASTAKINPNKSKETSLSNVSTADKNVANKVIHESAEVSVSNKSHISVQNADEDVIDDNNCNEVLNQNENMGVEAKNKSKRSVDQSKDIKNYSVNNISEVQNHGTEEKNKQNEIQEIQNESQEDLNNSRVIQEECQENDEEEEENGSKAENESLVESEEEIEHDQDISQEEIEQNKSEVNDRITKSEEANESIKANREQDDSPENDIVHVDNLENNSDQENEEERDDANDTMEANSDQVNNQENEVECDNANSDQDDNEETGIDQVDNQENDSEVESDEANDSMEANSDQDVYQENDSDQGDNQENDSDQENAMECGDTNSSLGAAAESDHNDDDDQIGNTETPNVSHDTTGRNRKKNVTPETALRNQVEDIDLTTYRGRNTSVRKSISKNNYINVKRSCEPARESKECFDGDISSSAEGSGWDSHRTTRKTLRQTFGKDFTPRKSLRALVMAKSAKRATAVIDESVARPQANSTEFPVRELSTNDYEMYDEPPGVQEVSFRTRQATLEECLEKVKMDLAGERAKVDKIVKRILEQGTTKIEDPFNIPTRSLFRPVAKPKPKAKKPQPLIPLDGLPKEFIEDMKYKPPKRFAPRNAAWLTKRLYKYLETKLEPKYDYKARVRAEKFAQTLYEFVQGARRRGAPPVAAPHAVAALKHEMARLNLVTTHYDFYNFFHEFMPREVRIKVIPDIVNKIPHPKNGVFSEIL